MSTWKTGAWKEGAWKEGAWKGTAWATIEEPPTPVIEVRKIMTGKRGVRIPIEIDPEERRRREEEEIMLL